MYTPVDYIKGIAEDDSSTVESVGAGIATAVAEPGVPVPVFVFDTTA